MNVVVARKNLILILLYFVTWIHIIGDVQHDVIMKPILPV